MASSLAHQRMWPFGVYCPARQPMGAGNGVSALIFMYARCIARRIQDCSVGATRSVRLRAPSGALKLEAETSG